MDVQWFHWYFMVIPTHEMGHAIAAWLCGYFALPVGALIPMAAITFHGLNPSLAFQLFWLTGLIILLYQSIRNHNAYLFYLALTLIFSSIYMTHFLEAEKRLIIISYGGIAGQFILATVMTLSFYYNLPVRWRWDFFRFPVFIMSLWTFTQTFHQWIKIHSGKLALPRGNFLQGASSRDGDIDRLLGEFHWTETGLITHFYYLGIVCMSLMMIHLFYFAFKKMRAST